MHSPSSKTWIFAVGFALSAAYFLGCNSADDGPPRYKLSGTANYQGKPISVGEISLTPDVAKGNDGPGSVAQIKDGKYETEADGGIVGGAYVVRIAAFDGIPVGESSQGTPLLQQPYEEHVEFPKQDSTKDFNIDP